MLDVLSFFAATEEGHESSKTLFYVLGALAAVYGVGIASIGITQPDFPKDKGTARGVFAASLVVVALAMLSAILTS